jgi:hypothetical protein
MANPDLWLSAFFVLLQFLLLWGLIRRRQTKPVAKQVAAVSCDVCAGDELLREVLEAERTAATERVNPSPRPILDRGASAACQVLCQRAIPAVRPRIQ